MIKPALASCLVAFSLNVAALSQGPLVLRTVMASGAGSEETVLVDLWARDPKAGTVARIAERIAAPGTLSPLVPKAEILELWANAEGWWSPRLLWVAGATMAPEIPLYPTATVSGRVEIENRGQAAQSPRPGEPGIASIEVRFQQAATSPPGTAEGSLPIPQDIVSCPVERGSFSCAVPAGLLDLRLKADGFVAHYRWGTRLQRSSSLDLGTLQLVAGSSVVGWVEAPTGSSPEGARVELAVASLERPRSRAEAERLEQTELYGSASPSGFFQISGVPPGELQAQAVKPGVGEASLASIPVVEGKETTLSQPLVLLPPARLSVRVKPPRDPLEKVWKLTLRRAGRRGGEEIPPASSGEESWTFKNLSHGTYWLRVRDSLGSTWSFQEVTSLGKNLDVEVAVDFVPVEGTVTLDGEPLAATLYFGGRSGARKIRMESDEEGFYSGLLPTAGSWRADLEAEEPPVRRRFRSVEVPEPSPDGPSVLDFSLSNLIVEGQLTDAEGKGLRGFALLVGHGGFPHQELTNQDGSFTFRGLDPGTFVLQGFAERGAISSETREITLEDGEEAPFQTLKIQSASLLRGRVASRWGGVAGASVRVHLMAEERLATLLPPHVRTGPDGSFSLRLPAEAEAIDLTIAAPGYGLKAVRVPDDRATVLEIPVFREAGTLILQGPEGLDHQKLAQGYFLQINGARLDMFTLGQWSQRTDPAAEAGTITVPMVEFGTISLCPQGAGPNKRCVTDVLAPFGEIVLELPQ